MRAAMTKGPGCVLRNKGTAERVQGSEHNLSACVKSVLLKSSSHRTLPLIINHLSILALSGPYFGDKTVQSHP